MDENKKVDSRAKTLEELFSEKYDVDFYQREYVWQKKQIEDLLNDLTSEFLKNWNVGDAPQKVLMYDPYFMGEIVVSEKPGKKSSIIDGQQRITTFTLLLIYIWRTFGKVDKFPSEFKKLICSDYYGTEQFNLEIEERRPCMEALFNKGTYDYKSTEPVSVKNLVERYNDIADCWDSRIDDSNIVCFAYWLKGKVVFSRVWTNSDEFAYVIFETMNDRGLSLTQVEMLRSYLLANIDENHRAASMEEFDSVLKKLMNIKLSSKSKAEFEFFKVYLRGHYAQSLSQGKNANSDFTRIGKEFHRWVRENENLLNLKVSADYVDFIDKISFFADVYEKINNISISKNTKDFLYVIVNNDYGFTMQPAVILSAIAYEDSDDLIDAKIKLVSKYLTKVLTWKVWNQQMISQSSLEASVYELCTKIRDKGIAELETIIDSEPIPIPKLNNAPILNQQNRSKLKVLLCLITEIVAVASGEADYMGCKPDIEVEHIWADHFEQHTDEIALETEFATVRNGIGDLLVLPKSFNASYGDLPYEKKVVQYFSQNILAQSLCSQKYQNNPGFVKFVNDSKIQFKSYDSFKRDNINERAELYKAILEWNWQNN